MPKLLKNKRVIPSNPGTLFGFIEKITFLVSPSSTGLITHEFMKFETVKGIPVSFSFQSNESANVNKP